MATMKQGRNWNVLTIIAMLILVMVVISLLSNNKKVDQITYSRFWTDAEAAQINKVVIHKDEGIINGEYLDGTKFRTVFDPSVEDLSTKLLDMGVAVVDVKEAPYYTKVLGPVLILAIPIALFFIIYFVIIRQSQAAGSQAFNFGKSKARMITDNRPNTTFKDVAGVEEAVEELEEVVEFLKERKKFIALGAKIPKGVLLVGPPGCGKTLLAKAIAGEANVPFFHMSGSDFVEMFVGVGASRVRDLFDQAKRNAPSIVFVDEIDAVGRQRGAGLGGGHDEREQTLNQLLVEMDGFDPNTGVILIAATNRPDILDPALLRPGRFDRRIVVDRPDVKGRVDILRIHTKEIPLDENVDLDIMGRRTPGFTGSDLKNLANEAAILAAREGAKKVSMKHFEESVDRVLAGPQRKSKIISAKEKEVIAVHEAGHALLPFFLKDSDPVHKISILPRGMALGYTLTLPTEDRYIVTAGQLNTKLMELLGGRIAEEITFDEVSTGAQDDLSKATQLSRSMVMEYGMSKKLGPLTFGHKHGAVFLGRDLGEERNYSEKIASQIDEEVRSLVEKAYAKARKILEEHKDKLDLIAKKLIEKEYLDGDELRTLISDQPGLFNDGFTTLPPSTQEETEGTLEEAIKDEASKKTEKKPKGLRPEPA